MSEFRRGGCVFRPEGGALGRPGGVRLGRGITSLHRLEPVPTDQELSTAELALQARDPQLTRQ
jgi:hypothetical protein